MFLIESLFITLLVFKLQTIASNDIVAQHYSITYKL